MADFKVPPELVDRMMVKCARRCCICRRFRPTKLQAHHIIERSRGGTDDEDNLIVSCISCHTDVHSKVPFARRFSVEELKGHRDALIHLVAEGRFPDEPDSDDIDRRIIDALLAGRIIDKELSATAVELLSAAAHARGNRQGMIVVAQSNNPGIFAGNNKEGSYPPGDRRLEAKYRAALSELEEKGLIEHKSDWIREVTHLGYLRADEIASEHVQETGHGGQTN